MTELERQQASELSLLKRQIAEIRAFLGMDAVDLERMEYLEAIAAGDGRRAARCLIKFEGGSLKGEGKAGGEAHV